MSIFRFRRLIPLLLAALLLLGLSGATAFATELPQLNPIQVFDVAAGKVVKSVPNDSGFQKMAGEWISTVTGLAPQITTDQSCGYVYRVPLAKPGTITTGTITVTASDLFLFYCKDKPPMMLAFDEQRKPYLFLFKADIAPFVKKVGLPASTNP